MNVMFKISYLPPYIQYCYYINFMSTKQKVAYFYNEQIAKFYYYKDHPMKPLRMAMANSLIESFDIYRHLDVYKSRKASKQELLKFHHPDYIQYLSNYICKQALKSIDYGFVGEEVPDDQIIRRSYMNNQKKKNQFNIHATGDCPGFSGLYQFCQLSCGGSIDSAKLLLAGEADIAINWGGGLHHAKKCEASGFCYTNDIVLGILELLRFHARVLYIDIDVHHGDGVEEAFYLTNRVMTVSFHQYGDFFPGTGGVDSVGQGQGKYYSLNVPLKIGIDDDTYFQLFRVVMNGVMDKYRPGAIVLQLGADALAGDKLGGQNLTIRGHGRCVQHMKGFGIPMMMVGGGGYTVQNVARCWAYQTGLAVGIQLEGQVPKTDLFYKAYSDNKLHYSVKPVQNKNTRQYIQEVKKKVFENISMLQAAPGVAFHNVPSSIYGQMQTEQQVQSQKDCRIKSHLYKLISRNNDY